MRSSGSSPWLMKQRMFFQMASIARMKKSRLHQQSHILKTVGLYGEVKDSFGPVTPERAIWDQRAEEELQIYMALSRISSVSGR